LVVLSDFVSRGTPFRVLIAPCSHLLKRLCSSLFSECIRFRAFMDDNGGWRNGFKMDGAAFHIPSSRTPVFLGFASPVNYWLSMVGNLQLPRLLQKYLTFSQFLESGNCNGRENQN
jgi:hypothetical protein